MVSESIALIALIYEACISIVFLGILFMGYRRKREKDTELTRLLFSIFIGWSMASVFLLLQKIINYVFGGVPYQELSPTAVYFVGLIHSGRFGYVSVIMATVCAYYMYLRVFKSKDVVPKKQKQIALTIGIVISVYISTAYQFNYTTGRENPIFMIFGFTALFIFVVAVYLPFSFEAFKLARRLTKEEIIYKKGIISLGIMSLCIVLMFIFFLIDQILLITQGIKYSAFYFSGWMFAIFGLYLAYLGYLKPGNS